MYSNDLVCNILEYIEKYINTKITIEDLEINFFYNRYYIMKLFKKEIGVTIFDFINKNKINNCLTELNSTNKLLINIALNNGFYSLEYFSEIFKKEIGISPRTYRKIINNKSIYNNKIMLATTNIINIKKLIDFSKQYRLKRKIEKLPVRKISIFN